jgi:probable addiction module antidote protein
MATKGKAKPKLKKWDSAAYLKTDEDISLFWEASMEEAGEDPAFITAALATIAKAHGMMALARETGLTREGLYKALSPNGNPEFATVMKVIRALGLHLHGSATRR